MAMAVLAVCATLLVVALSMDHVSYDAMAGTMTLLALILITLPILSSVARKEGGRSVLRLLQWALAAKVGGTLLRHFFITVIYGNNGDAGVYSGAGIQLSEMWRNGQFTLTPPSLAGRGAETARIAVVVGAVYMITGVSRFAASFVFSFICFGGQILMWRAFRRAVPEGDHRRYAALVLFLPSMLFWPSSIGKEALMVGAIGLVSYGAAQLLGERIRAAGVVTFLAGVSVLFFIRPHMAMIAIVSLGFAVLFSSVAGANKSDLSKGFIMRMITLVVMLVVGSIATTQVSKVLGGGDDGGVTSVLSRTQGQTATGGSEFEPPAATTPLDVPASIVTVLFRPFPWEASSANGLVAGFEGIMLLVIVVSGRRRILMWFKTVARRPYLVFAATYAFVFIIAFSYIANFGILTRQRTQMLPLALVMMAMPIAPRTRATWFGTKPTQDAPTSDTEPADAPVPDATADGSDPAPAAEVAAAANDELVGTLHVTGYDAPAAGVPS